MIALERPRRDADAKYSNNRGFRITTVSFGEIRDTGTSIGVTVSATTRATWSAGPWPDGKMAAAGDRSRGPSDSCAGFRLVPALPVSGVDCLRP